MHRPLFYLVDPFDCFLIEHVAADTVDGVGGVADHRAFTQCLRGLLDQAGLGVIRIDIKYHAVILFAGLSADG